GLLIKTRPKAEHKTNSALLAVVRLLHVVARQVGRVRRRVLGDYRLVLLHRGVALLHQVVHLTLSESRSLLQIGIVAAAGRKFVSLSGSGVVTLAAQRFAQPISRNF